MKKLFVSDGFGRRRTWKTEVDKSIVKIFVNISEFRQRLDGGQSLHHLLVIDTEDNTS